MAEAVSSAVEQDSPPPGCWWQKADVTRRVLGFLTTNRDVLTCDVVCALWEAFKAPLPEPVTIESAELLNPSTAAWLNRNLERVRHIVLRGDTAASLPQLHTAAALRSVLVADCSTLQQLPVGLGGLQHLTALNFHSCPHLRQLPADLPAMTGLVQLSLRGTPTSLQQVPEGISVLTGLQDLQLHGCHMVQEIPPALCALTSLTNLELDMDCDSPELLPTLQLPSHLTAIDSSISQLVGLRRLLIRGVNQLRELPDVFGAFVDLRELQLVGLHGIATLPDSLGTLSALTCLMLYGADLLEAIPLTIGGLTSLKRLSMSYCHKLSSIPPVIAELSSLEHLVLGCHGLLDALPDTLGQLSNLTHLSIETASLAHLPDSLGDLASLKELMFNYCHCLQALPESVGRLSSLQLLSIDTCMHLTSLPSTITQLHSLTELRLHNGEAWPVQLPSLPAAIGHMPALRKLSLTSQHPPDDTTMPALPASLAASSSLQEITWGALRLRRG